MIYNQIFDLFKNRRTVRFASETDIPQEKLNKILEAAKTAPSFDKLYPYKIHVLTNSAEGRLKKERLLEYFRCGDNRPFTTWEDREILQPILSGVVLVYTWWPSVSRTPDPLQPPTTGFGAMDAIMGATMALIAAESLGLKTAFFACPKDKVQASLDITGNSTEQIVAVVTIANENLGLQYDDSIIDHVYKGQTAHIYLNKHHNIENDIKMKQTVQPFLKINWNIDSPIRPEFKLPIPKDPNNTFMWNYQFQDYVNPKLDTMLKETMLAIADRYESVKIRLNNNSNKIVLDTFQVFYTPPGSVRNIHIDGNGTDKFERWAINYLLPQGLDEVMAWFSPEEGHTGTRGTSVANTPYVNYNPAQMIKIAESPLTGLCLVNVGIPHNVTNNDTRPRYAVSLRSKFLESIFSYQEMYNYISEMQT